ncbi:hypothetical protein BRARA_A02219 [Brassica rapa]|uniref:Ubiquitin-like protease family profile domain-containing protein n=1 Tax=Brassica campestris TaxID=3711 RepID=A0A398AVR8_BRACM|nr:hypothetical protein BRARA_A02219 [Brassica rapa]
MTRMYNKRDYPPRLYPEGSSNLDGKVINHNFHPGHFPQVRETIGLDVWEELVNSPIGVVARLAERESMWSGRTVHYLLCRQLQAIRFSLLEFGEITGLNKGPLPTEKFDPDQYNEFWGELKVPLGMRPKLDALKAALAFCPRWSFEKRKWLGLLLLQAMGVYCLHHNLRIPFQSAIRVFDDETMRSYPWGRTAYEVLIDSIKTLAPDGGSYTISGMKDALLIWAYESVTCFGESFGRVINNEDVLLLRCGGQRTCASFDKLLSSEIEKHGEVRVRRMVLKDSIEEMFPIWPGEDDDPQLVSLLTDIHSGRFVKEAEPPTKKQKKVKTQNESEADAAGNESEADAAGKGSSGKEGSKELELENKATLTTIVNTLDITSRKFDQVDSRLEAYELDRNRPLMDQKTIDDRKSVNSPALVDATPRNLRPLDFLVISPAKATKDDKSTKDDKAAKDPAYGYGCRRTRIVKGEEADEKKKAAQADAAFKRKEKNVTPSSAIYDPLAPVDPALLEKLMQHIKAIPPKPPAPPGKKEVLTADHESDFYSILIHERPWSEAEYLWVFDNHVVAYMNVLIKRSMREPTPFLSKRIVFVDFWWQSFLLHDYTQFKMKPTMFLFKGNGYEHVINGRIPDHSRTNLKWYEDVDHVDLKKEKIDCYDPIFGEVTPESEQKILNSFKPLTHMIPAMLSVHIPANIRPISRKKFPFRRRSKRYTPQNTQIGDCGVYSLKFVECLALNVTFDGINDQNIQGLWMKMAADILAEARNIQVSSAWCT